MLAITFVVFSIYVTFADTRWAINSTNITEFQTLANGTDSGMDKHNGSVVDNMRSSENMLRSNEDEEVDDGGPLLVGFGGNPFQYSILAEDYWKGLRISDIETFTNKTENRGKRALWNLYSMIKCGTGCSRLDYISYGCFCGLGGFGTPVDGIDECCQLHDMCYKGYTESYYWTCSIYGPRCSFKNSGKDYSNCECDRRLTKCLNNFYCPRKKAKCHCSPWCWLRKEFWSGLMSTYGQ